jgi:hypothetical protein
MLSTRTRKFGTKSSKSRGMMNNRVQRRRRGSFPYFVRPLPSFFGGRRLAAVLRFEIHLVPFSVSMPLTLLATERDKTRYAPRSHSQELPVPGNAHWERGVYQIGWTSAGSASEEKSCRQARTTSPLSCRPTSPGGPGPRVSCRRAVPQLMQAAAQPVNKLQNGFRFCFQDGFHHQLAFGIQDRGGDGCLVTSSQYTLSHS